MEESLIMSTDVILKHIKSWNIKGLEWTLKII